MDPHLKNALDAILAAEQEVAAGGAFEVTDEHRRHIQQLMERPENQDGADKSHVWRTYEYVRRHFAAAQPLP
jgi:hypothetical protein